LQLPKKIVTATGEFVAPLFQAICERLSPKLRAEKIIARCAMAALPIDLDRAARTPLATQTPMVAALAHLGIRA
jgi:hypothetical protein